MRSPALRWMVGAAIVTSLAATIAAMPRNSATFDEIAIVATGARAYETGDLALQGHPPLMPLLYGLPVHLSSPTYPDDSARTDDYRFRYQYAKRFFWESGNDADALLFRGRLIGAAFALLLLLTVFFFTRSMAGEAEAAVATILVAFLPDVLAHSGVAYTDVPFAWSYLVLIWALHRLIATPTMARGAASGAALALCFAIKNSAPTAVLAALALLTAQLLNGLRTGVSWKRIALANGALALAFAIGITAVHAGHPSALWLNISGATRQATVGLSQGAFLLGNRAASGWWYFFPVVFFFKTSLAFQALLLLSSMASVLRRARNAPARTDRDLRALVAGLAAMVAVLLASTLNLGFRYALPALPLVCILMSIGVVQVWRRSGRSVRAIIVALLVVNTVAVLRAFPFFLSYASAWAPAGRADRVFVDSNLDWGQGLIALREFQLSHATGPVYLAYHGSALPAGYGIEHVPWPSYHPLPPQPAPDHTPRYAVISATLLQGLKLVGDPYAQFRDQQPERVVGGSLLVFPLPSPAPRASDEDGPPSVRAP